ncbi:RAD9, HUS1, RAD1-interacting nuclear orphan protein 1 isoform X1 [Brachyistius frenatus]|uniref:RAD9, HUS1, RAD1-interacting nuclear orphan protein 1 isoform X1 n=1 Tax=Brachyistius frenatus TaxID=100188 RepID=UPI0037E8815E
MPRKVTKTEKPPLLFLERPVCGAKLQNVPEVRAALNPRDYFTETQEQSSSDRNSWVRPQFDSSAAAALPVRRGRRKCQSATSILDSCNQPHRKNSMCKYPSLSFKTGSRDRGLQTRSTCAKKAATVVSDVGNQPRASGRDKRTVSSAQYSDTPKRRLDTVRKRKAETFSDGAASRSRCSDQPETPSIRVTERCHIPADGAATPAPDEFSTAEDSGVAPPPDVDTPKAVEGGNGSPSYPHLLLGRPRTPPRNRTPDILVADTPEEDYGVKVTWRRRKGLMLLLKERGDLSEADAQIHS